MVQIILWLLNIIPDIIYAYTMVLVVYALLTWLPNARTSTFGQIVARLAEPYLNIFHRLVPSFGGISFSVIVAILFLNLVEYGIQVILLFLLRLL